MFRGGARSSQGDAFSDQRGNLEASLQCPFQCLTMTVFVTCGMCVKYQGLFHEIKCVNEVRQLFRNMFVKH